MKPYLEAQRELYALLASKAEKPFFLRSSRNGDGLWVSDILRRDPAFPIRMVEEMGYAIRIADGMTEFGFSDAYLSEAFRLLPEVPLCYPAQAWKTDAYALGRLLLSHPHSPEKCDVQLFSRIYWLTGQAPKEIPTQSQKLIRYAAALLREHRLCCEPGGRWLALWLQKGDF